MFTPVLLIAFLCGLLPALLWLAFWLLEDKRNPEPKRYIFFTFIAGMAVVIPIVLPLERFVQAQAAAVNYAAEGFLVLFFWAAIEETFKFAAAYIAALHWRVFDEPLDGVIYMVTAALGFAALENMLFLVSPIQDGQILQTIVTGDLRFVGATLLHVLSSATIGIALAYSFGKSPKTRLAAALLGVVLATALHTTFNFFILSKGSGATFFIFLMLWLGIVALLLFVERIKRPTVIGNKNAYTH
jgi:RsiW-degrading membrane proteinase PrsW (M82 family)